MVEEREERGQSIVEIAIILPVLLILLFGLVEVGFGLRNYLLVVNANREAARFAARGRFSDAQVGDRLVSAGGVERIGQVDLPFLRTHGDRANTGIILTHVHVEAGGDVISHTAWFSGVVPVEDGAVVPPAFQYPGRTDIRRIGLRDDLGSPLSADTRISMTEVLARHQGSTVAINAVREANDFDPMDNHVVIVETYYMHHPLGKDLLPDPWLMYTHMEIRLVADRAQ